MENTKKSIYKSGKIKVNIYEGVIKLSELKKKNPNELILPLGIIIDKEYVNNKDFADNEELFFDMFITYYSSPKKDRTLETTYTQISIEKLFKLFFEDKIFLDKLIFSDKSEKQINYITFSDNDFVLGFINKRGLFRKETQNVSLKEILYSTISEYLKDIRKNKVLTKEEIDEIHKRGNVTIGEIVREWEANDLCMPADASGMRCREFKSCHDCLIDYASYSLEHTPMSSFLKLTNLEDFPPIERPDITLYELYDTEECISGFFDTNKELDLYINASGSKGKRFKLDFYYHKDGIDNVVVETDENGKISCYKIIDEETCVIYSIEGECIQYLGVDLLYWPITDVLKTKGISFNKDKCKVK